MYFQNREQAGQELAEALSQYCDQKDTMLLALPRGGVPIAAEMAARLNLPFDIILVRKIGVPGHSELAMGAIAENEILYINRDIVNQLRIPQASLDHVIANEKLELERRSQLYRENLPAPDVAGKTVIVVDDGLATGATMHAAVDALQKANTKQTIVAVPVGAKDTCDKLAEYADNVICLHTPDPFYGVGRWYIDFSQVTDQEVIDLLKRNRKAEDTK